MKTDSKDLAQEAASPDTTNPPVSKEAGGASRIAKALCAVQARMKTVAMSGENKFDRYTYAKLVDYLDVCRKPLADCGLSILCSVMEIIPLDDRPTKGGVMEHAVRVKIAMTILHESGEQIIMDGYGEGQDRADKAVYKAITGARKYLLGMALNLASGEGDPEGTEREPEEEMDANELKTEITGLAVRDRLSDAAIVKCYNDLTGEFITNWRTQKVPTLNRIYRGWGKLVAQSDKLGLRGADNLKRVTPTQNTEEYDDQAGDPDDTVEPSLL